MKRFLALLTSALVFVGAGAALALPSAGAAKTHAERATKDAQKRGRHGRAGQRGRRGPQGPKGATGPAGPQGAPGVGTLNFSGTGSKSVTVGNFTLSSEFDDTTSPPSCLLSVRIGNLDSFFSDNFNLFTAASVNNAYASTPPGLPSATLAFTGITKDGSSTATGIIGCVNSAGLHLSSGYVTGV